MSYVVDRQKNKQTEANILPTPNDGVGVRNIEQCKTFVWGGRGERRDNGKVKGRGKRICGDKLSTVWSTKFLSQSIAR